MPTFAAIWLAALFAFAVPLDSDARSRGHDGGGHRDNPTHDYDNGRGNDRGDRGDRGGRGGHGHDKETPSPPSGPTPETNVGSSGPADGPDTRRALTRDDACQWPFWHGTFLCRRD